MTANRPERPEGLGAAPVAPGDRWAGLRTLIRARLLIAAIALPAGLLLRPEAGPNAWHVLVWSALGVVAFTVVLWLGTMLRRGLGLQTALHLAGDAVFISALAGLTGGSESQFVLLFVLVAIAGGVQRGLSGGILGASLACSGYLAQPWIAHTLGIRAPAVSMAALPSPGMLVALLAVVGVLAGVLGRRAERTRERLERTSRELNRLRLDNDAILRHLTSGVITLDSTGTVAYLNPAAEEVLGVRLREAQGRWMQDALPERLEPLRTTLLGVLECHETRARGEVMVHRGDGRPLPLGFSTNLLTHEGAVTGAVAVFTDLSDVREMEQRARRNQTLAEVGTLAAGIAHELRNGLNPISGSIECLQRELKLEGENAQLMELIQNECSRLNRFVTDLLTYSREREVVRQPLDLDEQLAELCEVIARDPRCRPGITVRFQHGEGPGQIQADREQLRQVWLNLAANALEAMPESGTLLVRWRTSEETNVVVEFVDNGPGIAAEHLSRVGQPFFTTKQGGTGLGLAIAQRIVERHGGTLTFESGLAGGTTARVMLPGATTVAAPAA